MKITKRTPLNGSLWALAMVTVLSGCDRQPVVATVDGQDITAAQLLAEAKARNLPADSQALQQLLELIIDRNAAARKADMLDLNDDPDFQRAYQDLVLATLKTRFQADWEQELNVTELEIKAEYERNPARYTEPETVRVALIEFDTDPASAVASDAVQQLQSAARGEARDRLFQSLAVAHSADRASRYRGGDVGVLERGRPSNWPDAVLDAAFALAEPGDLSPLIEVEGKRYVLKLATHTPAELKPLEKVHHSIRQRLLTARFDEIRSRTRVKIREDVSIRQYPEALAAVAASKSPSPLHPPGPALNSVN